MGRRLSGGSLRVNNLPQPQGTALLMGPLVGAAFALHVLSSGRVRLSHHILLDLKSFPSPSLSQQTIVPHESRQCVVWRTGALEVPGPLDHWRKTRFCVPFYLMIKSLKATIDSSHHSRHLERSRSVLLLLEIPFASRSRGTSFFINLTGPIKCLPVLQPLPGPPSTCLLHHGIQAAP